MLLTRAKLTGLVLLIVPVVIVPIIVLGRRLRMLGRENQEWIAKSSGNASESLLSVQTVQAFTHEDLSRREFSGLTEESFVSAKRRIGTRAVMTVIVISLIFSGVVGVLWIGKRDVTAGRSRSARWSVRNLFGHGGRGGRCPVGNLERVATRCGCHRAFGRASERRGRG